MIPPLCKKQRGTKDPLDEGERGEWKSCLKLNIQKMKIMASSAITSWHTDGETMETMRKLSAEELMFLNCGVGEDSWEFLGLQGD